MANGAARGKWPLVGSTFCFCDPKKVLIACEIAYMYTITTKEDLY